MLIGFAGKSIIEVFNSIVTTPAALAAGMLEAGATEEKRPNDDEELNVFTVLISILSGKELMFCI